MALLQWSLIFQQASLDWFSEENTPWTELNRQGKLLRTIAGEVKTIVMEQRLHSTPDPTESWGHIASGQGEGDSGWKTTKRNSGLGMGVRGGMLAKLAGQESC